MWLPRRAYVDLITSYQLAIEKLEREITFLRDQLATKREHEQRVERAARGLPEAPAPARPVPEVAPDELFDILGRLDSQDVADQLYREAMRTRQTGVPWTKILEKMRDMLPPPPEEEG